LGDRNGERAYLSGWVCIPFIEGWEATMPIYEFQCRKCETRFEEIRPLGDDGSSLVCPDCGTRAPEKVFSVFAAGSDQSDAAPCGNPDRCGTSFG
jgi:putative FmdB family regulatory protein